MDPRVSGTLTGAGTGAAIGSYVLPGLGTLAGGLIGGALGFFSGSEAADSAEAQQRMAMAQAEEARRTRELAMGIAGPASSDLLATSQYLDLSRQILGRTGRELENLSTNLAARTQGQSLQGEGLFSDLIARNRATQRAQLLSTLRSRLGPGAETSSIGMQALNQFDQQTVDIGVQAIPEFLKSAYSAIGAAPTLENIIKNRQLTALQATPTTQYQGAENVGNLLKSQYNQQALSSLMETGAMMAPSLGKMFSKTPQAPSQSQGSQSFFYINNQPTGGGSSSPYLPGIRIGAGTSFPGLGQ